MIALYKGTDIISRTIRFFNWGGYSHASYVDDDLRFEIQAWIHGVTEAPFGSQHKRGTQVDLFNDSLSSGETELLVKLLRAELGCRYDFRGLLGFLARRQTEDPEKWFCSELIANKFEQVGRPLLLRIPSYKVYPGLLSYSPVLKFLKTIEVGS